MRTKELTLLDSNEKLHYKHRPFILWVEKDGLFQEEVSNIITEDEAREEMFQPIRLYDYEEVFFIAMLRSDAPSKPACFADYENKRFFYKGSSCLSLMKRTSPQMACLKSFELIEVANWLHLDPNKYSNH